MLLFLSQISSILPTSWSLNLREAFVVDYPDDRSLRGHLHLPAIQRKAQFLASATENDGDLLGPALLDQSQKLEIGTVLFFNFLQIDRHNQYFERSAS